MTINSGSRLLGGSGRHSAGRRLSANDFLEPFLKDNGALFSNHEKVPGVLRVDLAISP